VFVGMQDEINDPWCLVSRMSGDLAERWICQCRLDWWMGADPDWYLETKKRLN